METMVTILQFCFLAALIMACVGFCFMVVAAIISFLFDVFGD